MIIRYTNTDSVFKETHSMIWHIWVAVHVLAVYYELIWDIQGHSEVYPVY